MVSDLFSRLQGGVTESVRWESMAAFATMLADMLVCGDGLLKLSPGTVRFICVGREEDNISKADGFQVGNTDPASADFNNAQPMFYGTLHRAARLGESLHSDLAMPQSVHLRTTVQPLNCSHLMRLLPLEVAKKQQHY